MSSINQYHTLHQRYVDKAGELRAVKKELEDFNKKHDTVELEKKYRKAVRKAYWYGFFTLKDNNQKAKVLMALFASPVAVAAIVNLRIYFTS